MSETEAKSTATKPAPTPAASPAPAGAPESAAAAPSAARPRLVLVAIGVGRKLSAAHLGRLVAALLFLGVCLTSIHFLRNDLVFQAEPKPEAGPSPVEEFPSALSPTELALMGEGALTEADVESASRFFEEARIRAERGQPDDLNLAVDIFEGLARVAEQRGRPRVAELYRDYVTQKQAELGSSLPIFSAAERSFRAGELIEARKSYARFLLTRDSLGPAGERYVTRAERRLAEIWEQEFAAHSTQPESIDSLVEPKEYFDERR